MRIAHQAVFCGAILLAATSAVAQQSKSIWDGVYTQEQADRGKALYTQQCGSCHGAKLDGQGPIPPLAGADFKSNWNGQTLADLLDKMQTSMPADKPGSLSREQNADILAFVLLENGFPSGKSALPSDATLLAQIKFEATKK